MLHISTSNSFCNVKHLNLYLPTNSGYMASNIEGSVNKFFSVVTTLNIPNVQPNDYHIRFSNTLIIQSLEVIDILLKI